MAIKTGDRIKVIGRQRGYISKQLLPGATGTVTGVIKAEDTDGSEDIIAVKLDNYPNPIFDIEPYGWSYAASNVEKIQ